MNISLDNHGYKFIYECIKIYNSYGTFLYMYLFFLIIIFFCVKKSEHVLNIFVYPLIFLLVTVFNPLIANIFIDLLNMGTRYYRFFWMLPICVVIAYFFTEFVTRQKKRLWQVSALIGVVLMLILIGKPAFLSADYKTIDNKYKISDEVMNITELIKMDSTVENPVVIYDSYLMMRMRTYEPSILSFLDRKDLLNWSLKENSEEEVDKIINSDNTARIIMLVTRYGHTIDIDLFKKHLDEAEINYIIQNRDVYITEYLESAGCTVIIGTENYILFKYKE